jgi:hypothetical protein
VLLVNSVLKTSSGCRGPEPERSKIEGRIQQS